MIIKIAERHRPYTTLAGMSLPVPGTSLYATCYPTHILVKDFSTSFEESFPLPVRGPVKQFLAMIDLERSSVVVSGIGLDGLFRYRVMGGVHGVVVVKDKELAAAVNTGPRLSMGVTKSQDWELVRRRCTLNEIMPLWCRLAQTLPQGQQVTGAAHLFNYQNLKRDGISAQFASAAKVALRQDGVLFPALEDRLFQGIDVPAVEGESNPLTVLTYGAAQFNALLYQEQESALYLLPKLPPECHAGRYTGIVTRFGLLSFEWTKKRLRQVMLMPTVTAEIQLVVPKSEKRMRLTRGDSKFSAQMMCGDVVKLTPGVLHHFDCFKQ